MDHDFVVIAKKTLFNLRSQRFRGKRGNLRDLRLRKVFSLFHSRMLIILHNNKCKFYFKCTFIVIINSALHLLYGVRYELFIFQHNRI